MPRNTTPSLLEKDGGIDTLRLSEEKLRAVLQDLRHQTESTPEKEQHRHERLQYHVLEGLEMRLADPDSGLAHYRIYPVNISRGGLTFLHGTFTYPGTPCTVLLKTTDAKEVVTPGVAIRCRCLDGRVHEVAVEFDKLVDVSKFVVTHEQLKPQRE